MIFCENLRYLREIFVPFARNNNLAIEPFSNLTIEQFRNRKRIFVKKKNMADDKKIIFSMAGVSKTYQSSNKTVLNNIYLSFFTQLVIGY